MRPGRAAGAVGERAEGAAGTRGADLVRGRRTRLHNVRTRRTDRERDTTSVGSVRAASTCWRAVTIRAAASAETSTTSQENEPTNYHCDQDEMLVVHDRSMIHAQFVAACAKICPSPSRHPHPDFSVGGVPGRRPPTSGRSTTLPMLGGWTGHASGASSPTTQTSYAPPVAISPPEPARCMLIPISEGSTCYQLRPSSASTREQGSGWLILDLP